MKFENPDIPEGINVSQEHPLTEFSQLVLGVLLVTAILLVLLNYSIGYFAPYLPFHYEQSLTKKMDFFEVKVSPRQKALQLLANDIAHSMNLPEEMKITVHYSEDDTVNAFATLGGHVFMFKGLLDKLPSEDALVMVMAHEIAHIQYRHPVAALGKGLSIIAVAGLMSGASNANDVLIGQSVNIGLLQFSRTQETQSDLAAVQVLQQRYQHIGGAKQLFSVFNQIQAESEFVAPEFFSSHPHSGNRWQELRQYAQQKGWNVAGEVTQLSLP